VNGVSSISHLDKLEERICGDNTPSDITMKEIRKLMESYGFDTSVDKSGNHYHFTWRSEQDHLIAASVSSRHGDKPGVLKCYIAIVKAAIEQWKMESEDQ
jgi:hypothetical protein